MRKNPLARSPVVEEKKHVHGKPGRFNAPCAKCASGEEKCHGLCSRDREKPNTAKRFVVV